MGGIFRGNRGSRPDFIQRGFCADRGFLELDAVGRSVDCQVSALEEGNVVLFPNLASSLSDELLEDLALIVFGAGNRCKEELLGADQLTLAGEDQSLFLSFRRSEADREAAAVLGACLVKLDAEAQATGGSSVHGALVDEAHDVVMGVRARLIAGDQGDKNGGSIHDVPLSGTVSLVLYYIYYSTYRRICQQFFEKKFVVILHKNCLATDL